jgi:ParB/RepB/Spo0J family partition protein
MLTTVPVSSIIPGSNDRKLFARVELEELAESIRTIGLIQSPTVTPLGDGRYRLVAGERRWRAVQLLDWADVEVNVREDLTPKQASSAMLAENVARADLDPIEEANAYASRLEAGWTVDELIATGVSRQKVDARIPLLKLRPDIQELIRKGQLKPGYGLAMAANGLDANRQAIALRKFQENPAPELSWFRRVCGELAAEQASEPMSLFFEAAIVEAGPVVKVALPPLPRTHKAPSDGDSYLDTLANQIAHWNDAADAWAGLGKANQQAECLAAASVLQGALDLMAASVRAPEPITGEVDMSDLYSTEQAAKYLGLSIAGIRYHMARGNLVPALIGKTYVFTEEQLDEFKANKRKAGNPNWTK